MAADQVQEKPKESDAKASDAAAAKPQEAPKTEQEKDAVGAQAKLSEEASGKPAAAQNNTDATGAATKDASDTTDTAETGEALTPWQKELQDLQKEREDLDRKMKNGELDANGVERHQQLEAGFKSMEEARAAGMSEAQIRAQFGNLVLEDKGSKSIELDGKASGRDKSTEGNFSLTMDGNQLVKFDDASWGISQDSSMSASIKVTLPDSAASVENSHGKMSVVPGADGTNARIIEMKDGTVLVNRGDEYVAMKPGTMGFGQQVLEGAEAKKLFESEEKNYDGVETTNAGGKITINSNGVNLVNLTFAQQPDIQTPESAQVMAQNENGKLMKLDDGTQMIAGPDNTAMIRSANGDVIKIDSNGQMTEMKAETGDASEAWNNEYKKFESDVKVAGSDGEFHWLEPSSWNNFDLGETFNFDNWSLSNAIDFGADAASYVWDKTGMSDFYDSIWSSFDSADKDITDGLNVMDQAKLGFFTSDGFRDGLENRTESMERNLLSSDVQKGDSNWESTVLTDQLQKEVKKPDGSAYTPQELRTMLDKGSPLGDGKDVKRSTDDSGNIVEINESSKLKRVIEADGSVTLSVGEGTEGIVIKKSGVDGRETWSSKDFFLEKVSDNDITFKSGDSYRRQLGEAHISRVLLQTTDAASIAKAAAATPDGVSRLVKPDGTSTDAITDESGKWAFHTTERGKVVISGQDGSQYTFCPHSGRLMKEGPDGRTLVPDSEIPFDINRGEDGSVTIAGVLVSANRDHAQRRTKGGAFLEIGVGPDGRRIARAHDPNFVPHHRDGQPDGPKGMTLQIETDPATGNDRVQAVRPDGSVYQTDDIDAKSGELKRYEKHDASGQPIGDPVTVFNPTTGETTSRDLNRDAGGNVTINSTGMVFQSDGDLVDSSGNNIWNASSGSFEGTWATSEYSGYTDYREAQVKEAEAKGADASGLAYGASSQASAALGDVGALFSAKGSICIARAGVGAAIALALSANDSALAGRIAMLYCTVDAADSSVSNKLARYADLTRMGNTTGDSYNVSAVLASESNISNVIDKAASHSIKIGRYDDPSVKKIYSEAEIDQMRGTIFVG